MLRTSIRRLRHKYALIIGLASLTLITVSPYVFASNIRLDTRYVKLSNSTASAPAMYEFGFRMTQTAVPVGSIRLQFCENSPIIGAPCVPPTGMDLNGAALASQSGDTGFVVSGLSSANVLILTRAASLPLGVPSTYTFQSIINPSVTGSYYVRLETFTSVDATGANVEEGGVVFAIVQGLSIAAEVPPYIRFCASVTIAGFDCSTANSYLIDLGEFTTQAPTAASSEFVVATNAASGYSVSINGPTLTSGNNIVPALTGAVSQPGTSQFGLNLRANTSPTIGADVSGPGIGSVAAGYNVPNNYRYQAGDTVVSSTNSSDNQKFTVSYIANIAASQPAGYYATTITYICLANF